MERYLLWKFSANMPKKWTVPNRRIYKFTRVKERDIRECLKVDLPVGSKKLPKSNLNVIKPSNLSPRQSSMQPRRVWETDASIKQTDSITMSQWDMSPPPKMSSNIPQECFSHSRADWNLLIENIEEIDKKCKTGVSFGRLS